MDAAFWMHEEREVAGPLRWGPKVGEATRRGREPVLVLRGAYEVRWAQFAEVGPSWCLVLEVPPRP